MMIDEVKEALADLEDNLFYGQADVEPTDKWNYSVFRRKNIEQKTTGKTYYYELAIVRENYIEDELEDKFIKAILDKTDLKLCNTDFEFDYYYNKKNSVVCEILVIEFYITKKVCYNG